MHRRASVTCAFLSFLALVLALATIETAKVQSTLNDIAWLCAFGLVIPAGILGSKRWFWLLLVYSVVFLVAVFTHLSFGF